MRKEFSIHGLPDRGYDPAVADWVRGELPTVAADAAAVIVIIDDRHVALVLYRADGRVVGTVHAPRACVAAPDGVAGGLYWLQQEGA